MKLIWVMKLINTNGRLPGGWRYEQLDANGKLLKRWERDFDPWPMFLSKVQSFRKLNQLIRQDIHFVEADVTEFLAREFGGDPKYFTSGGAAQKKTSPSSPTHSPSQGLAKFVARSRSLVSGAAILVDWLGKGAKPIPKTAAQTRADICTHQRKLVDGNIVIVPCPHNNPGWKPVESIANIIRSWSSKKNELGLSVEGEEKLHSCDVCLCDLKLKVHVPMATIAEQTPDAMFEKFASVAPENCWMRLKQQP